MRRFELLAKDFIQSSVFAIALVSEPAIRVGLVYLNGDKVPSFKLKFNEEKGIFYTPVLIPDQIIPRVDEESGEEFEVYFKSETIAELREAFMKAKDPMSNWNSQHTDEKLDGISVIDNWIVDGDNKAEKLGFNGLPDGTWMIGVKVENDKAKERIKSGEYFGVSIEGDFNHVLTKFNNQQKPNIMDKLKKAIVKLFDEAVEKKVELGSDTLSDGGTIYFEGEELQVGSTVYTDAEMTSMAVSGEYTLADGRTARVDETGIVVEVVEASGEEEEMKTDEAVVAETVIKAEEEEVTLEDVALALIAMKEKFSDLEELNASLKTELESIKEVANVNAEKLSKVSLEADEVKAPESVVEMQAQEVVSNSPFAQLRSKAINKY